MAGSGFDGLEEAEGAVLDGDDHRGFGGVALGVEAGASGDPLEIRGGEGGLEGLSLLRLFKGLRELQSVAAGVRGGSALMGSVLLAVW